ncbi:MAG: type VI secretion system baseplate subunit TssF [Pseudomonadota bacterium]
MEDVLQYFENELDYIRRSFVEFERAFPQKAKELGITAGRSSDPDVQRLADSLALEAARLNKRMDDTMPETAIDLMRMIAPGFLFGAPSYAVVQPDSDENQITEPITIPKQTPVPVTLDGDAPDCLFSVARDTSLAPVEVSKLRLDRAPFRYSIPEQFRGCEAALVVTLSPLDAGQSLTEAIGSSLELYVSAGGGRKQRLIDVLSGEVQGVGYASAATEAYAQRDCRVLKSGSHVLTMAEDWTTFVPNELTQVQSIARLRDFLAFPDKASFFTLKDTDGGFQSVADGPVELRFFLTGRGAGTIDQISDEDLATNVVPLINIFIDESRPVRYDYARTQVPVKPSLSNTMAVDCLQIRDIRKLTFEGEELLPCVTSPDRRHTQGLPVWQERYVVGEFDKARREVSFSTPGIVADGAPTFDFVASMYCSNGRAAIAPRPGMRMYMEAESVAGVPFKLMDEPSMPIDPDTRRGRIWDMLSMINGNFSSVYEPQTSAETLKEALNLCAPDGYTDAAKAICSVIITPSIAPVHIGDNVLLASGNVIEVMLDLDALPVAGHVFAVALHIYFSSLVSYDRFFQLKVRERGREQPFKVFPRLHGSQACG